VLVADDHALYRRGLEMVLSQEDDIEIVGEAGDGAEAIQRAEELLPDVVLMDIRMPRRSGIEACTAIKDVAPVDQDHHLDDLGRGVRPLRGGPGRRQRLPAEGRARARRSPTASGPWSAGSR
jgi:CheY-like chemotaxis protein